MFVQQSIYHMKISTINLSKSVEKSIKVQNYEVLVPLLAQDNRTHAMSLSRSTTTE